MRDEVLLSDTPQHLKFIVNEQLSPVSEEVRRRYRVALNPDWIPTRIVESLGVYEVHVHQRLFRCSVDGPKKTMPWQSLVTPRVEMGTFNKLGQLLTFTTKANIEIINAADLDTKEFLSLDCY